MGMDLYGRHPRCKAGEYFRATIWSWAPIHALIAELCPDLLGEETIEKLAYNDGAGPEDQPTCTEMARRFQLWMEQHTEGHELDLGLRMTPEGQLVSDEQLAEHPELETATPYQVSDDHLKAWIEFLCHCGGFEVW